MREKSMSLLLPIFWLFSATAFCSGKGPGPVLRGTVNIVLANSDGIVAVTDSNQTFRDLSGRPFTAPHPGKKLFRIDDKTVCTIAGFGSQFLPQFPDIVDSAAGALDSYAEKLQKSGGRHSFHEKFTSLQFVFESLLTSIGNLQHLDQSAAGNYGFESHFGWL
jgi:hypothetical protein